ncbi:acetyl-CoA synthetase-like protein [Trichoderma citrinoviride]|uniref:gluconokinase n=1 Tax=Trichoderma citrinoviride TaxID=58853 RepID=A0A2T4AXR2_9HYPO|nr:acetyl-CoA synthetase-like protein [Trichoderma citrinoviride]PTB61870.1 acetyl-CoA synthetase-like protein [Trichoderma citrinoviride]
MPATVYIPSSRPEPPEAPTELGLTPSTATTTAPTTTLKHDSALRTVDELVRQRAINYPQDHIVSYPKSGIGFVDYNLQQLDVFAWRAANRYAQSIPTRKSSKEKPRVVALLGLSNFEYLITLLALTKLGHTVLLLSTRITVEAVESLVNATSAATIIADMRHLKTAKKVQQLVPSLQLLDIVDRGVFDYPIEAHGDTQLSSHFDPEVETHNIAFIIHSSGSTGHPKPIYQPHKSCLANCAVSMKMKAFITLPLFHNHGICNFFRAVHSRKSIHLYNAELPLTQEYLLKIMQEHHFEIFYGVPYALKLLSESQKGISLLQELKVVMYGGSACPDDLGNLLVDNGVNLIGHYGATEVGQLMTSFRPEGDKAWNYVRESDNVSPFLRWVQRGPDLYECVVLDGWPSKVQSNQPDGSYATKDLFQPHPSIPKAWKYIARLDDTIVLVNGEKFNPVMMEGKIRSNKNVTEAVVFGAGRAHLGMLLVPAAALASRTEEEIIDIVWPVVDAANRSADTFARISRNMIRILPHDCAYPRTDKGSIIRQAFYKQFQREIDETYDLADTVSGELARFDLSELRQFLRDLLHRTLRMGTPATDDDDFFVLGLDSLQAIQMRSEILRRIDIRGNKLSQQIVFEQPSVNKLSSFLLNLRNGGDMDEEPSILQQMESLVNKYSAKILPKPTRSSIVVTGATGSLGAHVVAKLASRPDIDQIYCLVRSHDSSHGHQRVVSSMLQRRVYHSLSLSLRRKIIALPSDLSEPKLGLSREAYDAITENLTAVIHCAWSVNFNMHLLSFEKTNITGVCNLIALCQSAQPLATMNFCSSVSTCSQATEMPVPERVPDLSWAQNMGYAQSKSVAEHICAKAASQGITTRVLRIGQIIGDTEHGVWNAQEAVPMMIQTAITIGALPRLQETPSWLPVDVVADAVTDISLSGAGSVFANVTNPQVFSWTDDLLPALRKCGLVFDEVEPYEWIKRLRASNPDPAANPPIKLVDFFASKYDKDSFSLSKLFATEVARSLSPALSKVPRLQEEHVAKFVGYLTKRAWNISPSPAGIEKRAVIIIGPCGTGKSTIGRALSQLLDVPFIEGDELHSRLAIETMQSGVILADGDRISWLDRINQRATDTLYDLAHDSVVISCSALRKMYRDKIRHHLSAHKAKAIFIDLQADKEALLKRVQERQGHCMSADLVESQLDSYEKPSSKEYDVVPVDVRRDEKTVLETVRWILDDAVAWL